MKRKVTVIGHYGGGKEFADGQTIKTKNITAELCCHFGDAEVKTIDTHGSLKTLLLAPFYICRSMLYSDNLVILPACHGVYIFAFFIAVLKSVIKRCKVHYAVIGGWLPEFVEKSSVLKNSLCRFDYIYVETSTMKERLQTLGMKNVVLMPNFKRLQILSAPVFHDGKPIKLCTFSRVMKEKGIEAAVEVVKRLNACGDMYSLDIYGQVDEKQQEWFSGMMKTTPPYIKYKGIVSYSDSVGVLKDYDLLLFLTYYRGEGFAGTLLDAMAAGLPVIATDWRCNNEIVNENNGVLVNINDIDQAVAAIRNIPDLKRLKCSCLEESKKYSPEAVMPVMIENFR